MVTFDDIDRLVDLVRKQTRIEDAYNALHNCCVYEGTSKADDMLMKEADALRREATDLTIEIKNEIARGKSAFGGIL